MNLSPLHREPVLAIGPPVSEIFCCVRINEPICANCLEQAWPMAWFSVLSLGGSDEDAVMIRAWASLVEHSVVRLF